MSNKTKLWALGVGIICVVLLLLGIFGGFLPQLQKVSSTAKLADDAELMNDIYRAQITQLQSQQDNLTELEAERGDLIRAIPETPMSEALLAELHDIAEDTGAVLQSFTAGGAEAYVDPSEAEAATDAETTVADEGTDGAEAAMPAAAPAPAPQGLIAVPVSFDVAGSYDEIVEFFRTLQTSDRLLFVNSVSINEQGGSEGSFSGSMSGHMFVKASN